MKKHTISVLVENRFGVLAHISGLFSARGFNIDSLAVGETEDPTISRMTIVVSGDDRTLEQVTKQLNRLIDVIRVEDLSNRDFIDRELLLFKIETTSKNKDEVKKILKETSAKIIDERESILTVEVSGSKEDINTLFERLAKYKIKELVRTGRIALAKEKE
ncbi:MAG TPA: acetolactate synthase small subunit, partial [Candidatus Omnitrophica bacterium]|nr:acetolactate synthase small subunit [Candidatus Omnitrophota bacterium]